MAKEKKDNNKRRVLDAKAKEAKALENLAKAVLKEQSAAVRKAKKELRDAGGRPTWP